MPMGSSEIVTNPVVNGIAEWPRLTTSKDRFVAISQTRRQFARTAVGVEM
jgi:hypothetical protein